MTQVPAPVLQLGELYLKPADVAARLQVSRATVYALIASGELAALRVGLQLRVAPESISLLLHRWR